MQYMEKMKVVGTLHEDDQAFVDSELEEAQKNDPYAKDPIRHPVLIMHGEQPANAEVPYKLLTENYITPNEVSFSIIWYLCSLMCFIFSISIILWLAILHS